MHTEKTIKYLRINHAVAFIATLAIIVSFESGFLQKGVLTAFLSANDLYMLEITAVMTTIALIPLALKSFSRAMNKAASGNKMKLLKTFSNMNLVRISLLFVVIVVNAFIYYGIEYDGALYCGLFGYCALIYSYPSKRTLESYQNNEQEAHKA